MNSAAGASNVAVPAKSGKASKNSKQPVDLEELVGNTEEKRNWRGIIIALLVILTVFGLIVTAIILVTPRDDGGKPRDKMTFKSLMSQEYRPKSFHPLWNIDDDKFLYHHTDGYVYEFDCETNMSYPIMDDSLFRVLVSDHYQLSYDKKYALIKYDIMPVFRHSTVAFYKILNIDTKEVMDLVGPNDPMDALFQYVTWTPNRNSLVCVQRNDIYYLKNVESQNYVRYTWDGMDNMDTIFNGVPDWLYEEEILETDHALWLSRDGRYLLYAVFNDTEVRTYEMPYYGDMEVIYNDPIPLRYPKAGTTNPTVHLKIIDLKTNHSRDIQPPQDLAKKEHYFTTVSWQQNNHVIITWLNRAQNVSIVTICAADTGSCRKNLRLEADGGWVEMATPALSTPDGHHYFMLLPHRDGAAGSFQHIAMVDARENIMLKLGDGAKIFLTAGMWDVNKIVGYDDSTNTIYFLAAKMGDPTVLHLYSTTTLKSSPDFRKAATCITCELGDYCQYVEASFSSSGKYYVLGCLGPGVPSYMIYSTEDGYMRTMEENEELLQNMENLLVPREVYYKIPIMEGSEEYMWAKLLLPPVLKEDEIITYNLLFRVYGAPNTQMVTRKFALDWEHYLSSVHSVIIAYVDGRGTSGRGNTWLHANYKRLGSVEVDDTITAARFFNKLSYVNTRNAIWGMSYGAFLTTAALSRGTEAFKCGLAVAPVTDWRYYDTAYTERYMGLPTAQDNLAAYNVANLSRYAANFKSARYMVIHGTADDNVHFQNSAQLIKALTEADVYFNTQIYTDENHHLDYGNTKKHFYNTVEDFMLQCFGKPSLRPHEESDDTEGE